MHPVENYKINVVLSGEKKIEIGLLNEAWELFLWSIFWAKKSLVKVSFTYTEPILH